MKTDVINYVITVASIPARSAFRREFSLTFLGVTFLSMTIVFYVCLSLSKTN